MKDKVIIAGAGMVTSLGHSVTETWKALLSGGCGIKTIETPELRGFDCRSAAQVNLIPSSLNIHPRDARIMDMHSLMLMKSSRDAFKEAGLGEALSSGGFRGEDIGFFAGMGMVDYKIEDIMPSVLKSLDQHGNLDYDAFFLKGYQEIHPLWPLSMLNNISFCQVSTDLGIKGENSVFSPHSDSGMQAVAEAAKTLLDRKAKAALAGGVSEKVSLLSLARASYFGILNPADGVCRPFGKDRNGTILGEGCGIIAMELQTSAVQRGMPCLAAISGCGVSFGVSGDTDYPSSSAISDAMGKALEDAELRASDIDLIIANGDGTRTGDKNESEAIHRIFADCIDKINVFSSKGALGNMLAGAPAVDIILGIQIIQNGIIPATYNFTSAGENIMFNVVSREPLKKDVKRIMINSQSYEGQCSSLIIEAIS